MPKQLKEFQLDNTTGNISVEYDDNSTNKFNAADMVTAQTDSITGGTEFTGFENATVIANVSPVKTASENSAAIQLAIDRAVVSKAVVFIPGGQFDHQGFSLPANGGVTVRGNGAGVTILRNTHTTNNSVNVYGTAGGPYSPVWKLSDMTLTTDSADEPGQVGGGRTGQVGIDVKLASKFSVENIEIRAHWIGVRHEASWMGHYNNINVGRCNTGWEFPVTSYTPSAPFAISNGSAWRCATACKMRAVESLVWTGGDFAYSATGLVITGDDTRAVTFNSVNFEGITGDDVEFGDGATGPTNVLFNTCRFSGGSGEKARGLWMRRGQGLSFRNCHHSLYAKFARQESAAGLLEFQMCSSASVAAFLDSNGTTFSNSSHLLATPNVPISLNPSGLSTVARNFAAYDGLITKGIAGAGRTSAADGDFSIAPQNNQIAVVRDTTSGNAYLAVRVNGIWLKTSLTA